MLLYLVVKNHSFVDGNKRIAATLFLWFMQNNGILYRPDAAVIENNLLAETVPPTDEVVSVDSCVVESQIDTVLYVAPTVQKKVSVLCWNCCQVAS